MSGDQQAIENVYCSCKNSGIKPPVPSVSAASCPWLISWTLIFFFFLFTCWVSEVG